MIGDRPRGLVVIGCSRRKSATPDPLPALDRYQGNAIPLLRRRVPPGAAYRTRVRVLSAKFGLIGADEPITTYDQRMTTERANELAAADAPEMRHLITRNRTDEALLLMAPDYLAALPRVLFLLVPVVHVISEPEKHWDRVDEVLDSWRWP